MRRKRTKKLYDAENRIYDVLVERYNAGMDDLTWRDLAAAAHVRVKKSQWHGTLRGEVASRLARDGMFLKDSRRNRDEEGNYLYGVTQRPSEIEWSADVKRRVTNGIGVRLGEGRDVLLYNAVLEDASDTTIQQLVVKMLAKNAARDAAAESAVPSREIAEIRAEIRELASSSSSGGGFGLVD